jgi:hypothetical protein
MTVHPKANVVGIQYDLTPLAYVIPTIQQESSPVTTRQFAVHLLPYKMLRSNIVLTQWITNNQDKLPHEETHLPLRTLQSLFRQCLYTGASVSQACACIR